MSASATAVFRSLRNFNYRLWIAGSFVSNVGTWVQRTAQDWMVLTQLTHRNASAVGITMALQFGPQLLLLPWTGWAADRFNQRKMLMLTQATMGVLAVVQGILAITGMARLWHVYVLAFLLGCAAAFDAPVRQTFIADLVGDDDLPNAVALNSASFNGARLLGPAVAGLVVAAVGTGWSFVLNGVSFGAVLLSLMMLRSGDLKPMARAGRSQGGFVEGLRYVAKRPDLIAILVMLFLIGTFGLNFAIFIATMSVRVFHSDARGFGMLSSIMAIGTVSGALLSAGRSRTSFSVLIWGAAVFGGGCALAALAPSYWPFAVTLVFIGAASLTILNSSNALMQLSTEPSMRGRVLALRLAIVMGGTPIGAPIVGWVADHFGPRWSLGVGAAAGFSAVLVGLRFLQRHRPQQTLD